MNPIKYLNETIMSLIIKLIRIICLVTLISGFNSFGQGFVTPLESIQGSATIVTADGKTINGKIRSAISSTRGISRISIVDNNGTKQAFKSGELNSLKIKVDGLAKLEMFADNNYNINTKKRG